MRHVRDAGLIAVSLCDVFEGKQTATIRKRPRRYRDPSVATYVLEGDACVFCSSEPAALSIDLVERAPQKMARGRTDRKHLAVGHTYPQAPRWHAGKLTKAATSHDKPFL